MTQDAQVVNLLWTGGWDSTFRLLQLVILQKTAVQPYYVIDSERKSTGAELKAISRIKKALISRYPESKKLVRQTKFVDVVDIPPCLEVTQSYNHIRENRYIGSQYDWLARYCVSIGVDDMELSIRDETHQLIGTLPVIKGEGVNQVWRLDPQCQGTDEYKVFGRYRFPILQVSKVDIRRIAEKEGFLDLMELSWFCHEPLPNNRPCGVCNPCVHTAREGLGYRIPWTSRMRYYLSGKAALRVFVLGNKPLYQLARKLKRRSAAT